LVFIIGNALARTGPLPDFSDSLLLASVQQDDFSFLIKSPPLTHLCCFHTSQVANC